MSNNKNIVNKAEFTNPAVGITLNNKFEPKRDSNGKRAYSASLKVKTKQINRNFPIIIKAEKVASIVSAYTKKNQPLNIVEGVDYRLSDKSTEEGYYDGLSKRKVAYYKPVLPEIKRTTYRVSLPKKWEKGASFKITPTLYKVDKENDKLIEVENFLECDFLQVDKKQMESFVPSEGDWRIERYERHMYLERFCTVIIEKLYPDEDWVNKWAFKSSYKGNWNMWRNKELLSSAKGDSRFKNKSYINQSSNGDNYNDYDVRIHEEFNRDELDPDLREAWDDSFNKSNW